MLAAVLEVSNTLAVLSGAKFVSVGGGRVLLRFRLNKEGRAGP